MINFDGKELQEEFNKAFGNLQEVFEDGPVTNYKTFSIENLTLEQLWWLTKFSKHVRGRCRSNSAFNNYMNRNFSPARFENVLKEYNGRTYQGLKISKNDEISEGEDNE
jgi:hypothetical protein